MTAFNPNSKEWLDYMGQSSQASSSSNIVQGFKLECAHNEIRLPVGNGIVRGFSGSKHFDHLYPVKGDPIPDRGKDAINVFLDPSYVPRAYTYSNFRLGVPEEDPTFKIIYHHIKDQDTPKAKDEFAALVEMLSAHLDASNQVNISCIGGHGRTGLLIAILYGLATGSKTPFKDIRASYCEKAVESYKQECFIHSWLDLEKPKEELSPCSKCRKNPKKQLEKGWDAWCVPCNEEWEKSKKASAQPSSIVSSKEAFAVKCPKCFIRYVERGHFICFVCAMDVSKKATGSASSPVGPLETLPKEKPASMSKNAWKKLLKRFQGHSHAIAADSAIASTHSKSDEKRLAILNEIPLLEMTDKEWSDYIKINERSFK